MSDLRKQIGVIIRTERHRMKLDQKELCAMIDGLEVSALSNYERGYRLPSLELCKKLADVFGVSTSYILALETITTTSNVGLSTDYVRRVPIMPWGNIVNYQDYFMNLDVNSSAVETMATTAEVNAHTFALRVRDDSMETLFPQNVLIVVEPDRLYESGDYVIIACNGDATFRQLIQDGADWMMKPLNPRYPIKPMPSDAVIIGVIIAMEMKFK